jgi:hypothetical protein
MTRTWEMAIVLAGAAMIVVPAVSAPASGVLVAAGAVLVAASVTPPFRRWRGTGTAAAVSAVAACALARPTVAVLAAEGLVVLAYLLLLDGPRGAPLSAAALRRWLRQQASTACWAVATSAAVLVTLVVRVPVSAWLVVAGTAAAVAAAVIALPRKRRPTRGNVDG